MSIAGGHRGFTVKLTTNSINKAIKGLETRVERASIPALLEVAEKGKAFAEELYSNAQYDGEHDASLFITQEGKRTVDLTAVGDSVLFIEYGTGMWGSGKQKWYFSAKGRKIKLTATGDPTSYTRGGKTKTKYFYRGERGGKYYVSKGNYVYHLKDFGEIGKNDEGAPTITVQKYNSKEHLFKATKYNLEKEETTTPYEFVERTDSFVTSGNPPQYIMDRTKEYMMSIAPGIINNHLREQK